MNKYFLVITMIVASIMISGSRAEDDFNDEISSRKTEVNEIEDQKNLSSNAGNGQIKQNISDRRSDFYENRSSNYNQYNGNNNSYDSSMAVFNNKNSIRSNNNNTNYNRNIIEYDNSPSNSNRGYINPSPLSPRAAQLSNDFSPNLKDFSSGLSFGTLKTLSTLPKCKQQTLLNYRRLLRNPLVRLQFYRDLYQLKQGNYVEGCGEGPVKIGYRERAILLRDPYFKKKVQKLMSKQPIGLAIRGPINYPNDIGVSPQTSDPILTLNKRY